MRERSTDTAPVGARRRLVAAAGATIAAAMLPAIPRAQAYPSQPIRLVVPFPPAGATDVVARLVAERMASANGWNVVVENRPGAGGNLGLDAVAKAKADGYTLGLGQTANLAINPALYRKMPYDPLKDFAPVALIAAQPVVIVVRGDSPIGSLSDLVAAARVRPKALTMASAGNGTVGHLGGELFARRASVQILHVPYKGASQALADLVGGQTDFMLPTPQAALPFVKAGKIRAIAVTSARRLPVLPDVPSVAESGYPGFELVDWKALVAPAGTPAAIVAQLNAEAERAVSRPEAIGRLLSEGSAPMSGSPQRVAAFIRAEHARWGELVRQSGMTLD